MFYHVLFVVFPSDQKIELYLGCTSITTEELKKAIKVFTGEDSDEAMRLILTRCFASWRCVSPLPLGTKTAPSLVADGVGVTC